MDVCWLVGIDNCFNMFRVSATVKNDRHFYTIPEHYQVEKLVDLMFVEPKFHINSFRSKLKLVLEEIITFSANSQKVLLKMLNRKYKEVRSVDIKTQIEGVYQQFVDEYLEKGFDISCVLNVSNCEMTPMKGACGTLANKLKLAMNKESESKKYKEFVQDLKELMKPLM